MDYYPLSDLLYRTVALTDTGKDVVEAYDTDTYGNTLVYSGPGADDTWFTDDDVNIDDDPARAWPLCRFIFTGREYDYETGIYCYRARYYQHALGRFLSRDPIGYTRRANLYEYGAASPVGTLDAHGLLFEFKNCTEEQKRELEEAEQFAQRQIENLASEIDKAIAADTGQYPAWTKQKLSNAKRVLQCAAKQLQRLGVECHCSDTAECQGQPLAMVKWVFARHIHICPGYWDVGSYGGHGAFLRNAQAAALVHEATHKCGTIDLGYFWQSGRRPEDQGIIGWDIVASTYDTWILSGFSVPGTGGEPSRPPVETAPDTIPLPAEIDEVQGTTV